MRLRSQTTAALSALLDLSLHSAPHAPVPLSDVAKRLGVGVAFLEQLFRPLKKAGLVAPWRGMKGGYALAKRPEDISLLQVLKALDDPAVRPLKLGKAKPGAELRAVAGLIAEAEEALDLALMVRSLAQLRKLAMASPDLQSAPRKGAGFQI
jgi:Rrf2 family protein